jgi:hypothetical protein
MNKRKSSYSWLLAVAALLGCILLLDGGPCLPTAHAFYGLTDYSSPLVFLPYLHGEVQVKPIWINIASGKQTIPSRGVAWDLRDQFGLNQTNLFLDTMVRLQVGRLSFRLNYEMRDFVGRELVVGMTDQAQARFSYTGIRLGADFDIFQRFGTRAGVNLDYDLFEPEFQEAIQTIGGKVISGPSALTLGIHAVYSPVVCFYGISPVIQALARWPVQGSEVTDLELSFGIKTPETVLGSLALKGGYRRTDVEFRRGQLFSGPVSTEFDAIMSGWFGELAYYY